MRWILIVLLLGALGLAACSTGARLAVVNVTALTFDGVIQEQVFDPDLGLSADIYAPENGSGDVVVFFHGGSWQTGNKGEYPFVGVTLAREGFVVVIPDYRKYPEVRHPGFVHDAAKAVAWVQDNIAAFGGDPARIYVGGHSAGAHIAALLAADERFLAEAGSPGAVKGFAGLAGPYHFSPEDPDLVEIFGPPDRFPEMQVSTFIDGAEPPMMFQYGLQDKVVGRINIDRLSTAITRAGGCHAIQFYDDLDHIGIVSAFSWIYRDSRTVVDDMAGFFRAISAGQACPAASG